MSKQNTGKKIVATLIASMIAMASLTGCGGEESSTSLRFWGYGDITAQTAYKAMVKAYNEGQGKKDGVTVSFSPQAESGYISLIENSLTTKSGPDVFFAWDRLFKKWTAAGANVDLTEYVNASTAAGELDISKISKSTVDRFRYDKELNMSESDDPIYGLPIDTSPTSLFYNKTALKNRGITVISVDEEDMDKWNANEIADNYGHKKSDFPELNGIDVPSKGFFRDDEFTRKTYGKATDIDSAILEGVQLPASGVAMVFNDRIPMNWDEVEDIGWIMTGKKAGNSAASTDYGYYTEWWFNYGWSVGGDCVEDLSGNGSWTYTHGDRSANYVVAEGKTYVGEITGKTYAAGEVIDFLDKIDVSEGDVLTADNAGGYEKNGQFFGPDVEAGTTNNSITRPSVLNAEDNGTLVELPSIREAFSRFVNLSGTANVNLKICPYPTDLQSVSSIQYFTSGKLAFILECGFQIPVVEEYVADRFEWACAPLPVFKEYTEPSAELQSQYGEKADAYNDVVKRSGVKAGHSESTALVIREKSTKKDSAWKFVRWMVSEEAQRIKASYGFIPNQAECVDSLYTALESNNKRNVKAFVEAVEYETPGDWWYMIDRDWIATWSDPLNGDVRNGKITLAQYFDAYIAKANEKVESYGNWGNYNKVTKR